MLNRIDQIKDKTIGRTVYFRPDFYFETFKDYCYHVGISPVDLSELTGLSASTVKRWLRNDKPPKWVMPFLWAVTGHILVKGFEQFQARDKTLYSNNMRFGLTFRQIEEYTFVFDLMHQYRTDNERMRAILEKRSTKPAKILKMIKK